MHHRASVGRKAGARIIYVVSEAGTARFTVVRVLKGRRAHGRCVSHNASRRGKKCKRHVTLPGSFSHGAVAGRNKLRFTGHLNGRPLAPGRYKLAITVVDMTGDRSRTKHAGFGIKP